MYGPKSPVRPSCRLSPGRKSPARPSWAHSAALLSVKTPAVVTVGPTCKSNGKWEKKNLSYPTDSEKSGDERDRENTRLSSSSSPFSTGSCGSGGRATRGSPKSAQN
uniref:Uncharacterized protein n=1 Tax=Oryza rufipogon TaxID=4529 RepID=A0A0E0PMD6_ORYRU